LDGELKSKAYLLATLDADRIFAKPGGLVDIPHTCPQNFDLRMLRLLDLSAVVAADPPAKDDDWKRLLRLNGEPHALGDGAADAGEDAGLGQDEFGVDIVRAPVVEGKVSDSDI
jgi:hypothetical protein